MAVEIKVPTLGESVTEATVAKWFKQAGEAVAADEPLVELETDKVAMEWRGSDKRDWDKEWEGYWSDCTLIFDEGSTEIPKEDFDVLRKYLAVL